jgi:hypothetical protein
LQPLQADAAVVDLLAQEMFGALPGALAPQPAGGARDGDSSDSDSEQGRAPAAAQQQRQPPSQAAAEAGDGSSSSGGSDSDSGDEDREGSAGRHVPRHLRWQPDLVLPGAGRQQQGAQAGSSAAPAAGAVGVHVVPRGGKDSLHVPSVDARVQQKAARSAAPDTAGKGWFDLPATQITDEVKNDLRLLRLR